MVTKAKIIVNFDTSDEIKSKSPKANQNAQNKESAEAT